MSGCDPGAVAFDFALWQASYPEFSAITEAAAQGYWNIAGLYLNNSASSRVRDNSPGGARATLLNMLTSHIAQLLAPIDGQPSSQQVGRISNVSQGSVSIALDFPNQAARDAWYNQTKYGAMYLAAIRPYMQGGRYKPGRQPYLGVAPGGIWGGNRPLR